MAHFMIGENGLAISWFHVPLGRTLKLVQWGGDAKGNRLSLELDKSTNGIEIAASSEKLAAASTAFSVTGKAKDTQANLAAYVQGSIPIAKYTGDLQLKVGGAAQKQPGYQVDLLSQMALTGNAKLVHLYSRIILGPSTDKHVLSQNTTAGKYNCGDVAASYGTKLFEKPTTTAYFSYYLPPKTDQMVDLRFEPNRITQAVRTIKAHLDKGTAVRLWAIHDDGFSRVIQGDTRTHFLTVIGYSGSNFLFLDPWPTGSFFEYNGGMYPKTQIAFMGELSFDSSNLALGIRSSSSSKGAHKYTIIAGP